MGGGVVAGLLAADDPGEVDEVGVVAGQVGHRDVLVALVVLAALARQGQAGVRRLERADVHRALVTAHDELPPGEAVDFLQRAADRDGRLGVLQDRQLVVRQAVVVSPGMPRVGRDALRPAEDAHDGVDHVTAELEHRPAAVPGQHLPLIRPERLADNGVNREHSSQPSVADRLEAELKGRVVSEHVAHLDGELAAGGLVEDLPELRQRLAGRLVEVDVLARCHGSPGRVQQVADLRLHGHGLEALDVEQLLLGHPGQVLVDGALFRPCPPLGVRLDDADDLEVLRSPQRGHLAGCVGVSGADLPDTYLHRLASVVCGAGAKEPTGMHECRGRCGPEKTPASQPP